MMYKAVVSLENYMRIARDTTGSDVAATHIDKKYANVDRFTGERKSSL